MQIVSPDASVARKKLLGFYRDVLGTATTNCPGALSELLGRGIADIHRFDGCPEGRVSAEVHHIASRIAYPVASGWGSQLRSRQRIRFVPDQEIREPP